MHLLQMIQRYVKLETGPNVDIYCQTEIKMYNLQSVDQNVIEYCPFYNCSLSVQNCVTFVHFVTHATQCLSAVFAVVMCLAGCLSR